MGARWVNVIVFCSMYNMVVIKHRWPIFGSVDEDVVIAK